MRELLVAVGVQPRTVFAEHVCQQHFGVEAGQGRLRQYLRNVHACMLAPMSLVAIDCRFGSRHAGLGTFTREIVRALQLRNDPWRYVLFVRSKKEEWLADVGKAAEVVELDCPHYSLKEQFAVPSLLKKLRANALYSPQFNVPLHCPVPFVPTVHDLILHHYPNTTSPMKRMGYFLLMAHAIKHAAAVLTVSKATKADIVRAYGQRYEESVTVAHPGVSAAFTLSSAESIRAVRERHGIAGPYFVYVGNAKQHKNVQTLIDAFEQSGLSKHQLILVTGGAEAVRLRLTDRVRVLPGIPDADLVPLLGGADACVSATLAEGFGLPMLEAMACGCPVVATDIPAVREVCGDVAVLMRPSAEGLAEGMRHVITLDRATLSARGIAHTRNFSWVVTASATAELLAWAMRDGK